MTDWKYINESAGSVDVELILNQGKNFANMSKVALFACERQALYTRKQLRCATNPPWTEDEVLRNYKFTNCYRILDRTSQYLIREIINPARRKRTIETTQERLNLIAQIYIFKLFNRIETWEAMKERCKAYAVNTLENIETIWGWAKIRRGVGHTVFSNAYALNTKSNEFYNNVDKYMDVIKRIVNNLDVRASQGLGKLVTGNTIADNYEFMKQYHGFGDFLSYQFALDFSYAALNKQDYSFVVPGPGCIRGMQKVFGNISKAAMVAILRGLTQWQEALFKETNCKFQYLKYGPWLSPNAENMHLEVNDWQNIFCEFDKYSRIVYPEMSQGKGEIARKSLRNKYNENTPNPITIIVLPYGWN